MDHSGQVGTRNARQLDESRQREPRPERGFSASREALRRSELRRDALGRCLEHFPARESSNPTLRSDAQNVWRAIHRADLDFRPPFAYTIEHGRDEESHRSGSARCLAAGDRKGGPPATALCQERHPAIATERDEMKCAAFLVADESPRHETGFYAGM
jgi:hypothetical protein